MRRTKEQKGITLIALIITIVVLLILAVVAINSIQNDGIISKAEASANKYNESVQNEADQLQNYLDYLEEHSGNPKTYAAYTVGQEVKVMADVEQDGIEEEHRFYVMEDSDTTKETVVLLAKGNIDTQTFLQDGELNPIAFSSTGYWGDGNGFAAYDNLEESGEPDETHYAARAAYEYGLKLGGAGRLMTYR